MDTKKLKSKQAHAKTHRGKVTPWLERGYLALLGQHGPKGQDMALVLLEEAAMWCLPQQQTNCHFEIGSLFNKGFLSYLCNIFNSVL